MSTSIDPFLQQLAEKDFLTYQHSVAVADLMKKFAQKLGLEEDHCSDCELLGAIHDIAKLNVSDEIYKKLQSGANLTHEERAILHHEPEAIFNIISKDLFSPNIQMAIEHMHTRYDGKGTPNTAGESIHVMARMLKICDYYDLLGRHRAGHKPLSPDECKQVLQKNINSLFDPALVAAFLDS